MSDQADNNDRISKDQQKKTATSIERAHILSVLSKCKFLQGSDEGFSELIKTCLTDLDDIEETSLVLQALKFSDHVTICLDPKASDLSRIAKSKALGWYNYQEGELLIGAAELTTDRKYFMGVFAHELTHWCMQMVFKNNCLPYYQSDPSRVREGEFEMIVHNVQEMRSRGVLDCVVESVFRDYDEHNWQQELIVRVPHLMVQNGVEEAITILSSHQPTGDLLNFYREYVMNELRKFIAGGDLEKSRETVVKLNGKLGLLPLYRKYEFQFNSPVDVNLRENTSLWVFSSPHPYLSFLRIAWTLNCEENTEYFYGNNIFCDYDSFVEYLDEVLPIFRKLEVCRTLFIVCPEIISEASYKNLYRYLGGVLAIKPHKKVILTIRKNILSVATKQLNEMTNINSKFVSMKKIEFTDFLEDSQEMVLCSAVTLQEREVKLKKLLDKEDRHLCDGSLVERLIASENSKDKVIVENRKISHRDCPAYFVSIYEDFNVEQLVDLIHECCMKDQDVMRLSLIIVGELENYPDLLEMCLCETLESHDLSEISITSIDEFLKRDFKARNEKPVLLFTSSSEMEYLKLVSAFRQFCNFKVCFIVKIISKKVIYSDLMFYPDLLFNRTFERTKSSELNTFDEESEKMFDQDDFLESILSGTESSVKSLNNVNENSKEIFDQDDFMEMLLSGTERVNIISDKAGAGKTKFLNLLYNSTTHWGMIKYSLKFCDSFIDEHPLEVDLSFEDAMSFISKIGEIGDLFAMDLLRSRMTNYSSFPVVLLLDGMDEITHSDQSYMVENKEKIANLIRFLKNQTCMRVVVTTRPESIVFLSHLSCPVYEFSAISRDKVESYLTDLCVARSKLFSKSTIPRSSANELVRKYINGIADLPMDFLMIPLDVTLLSEVIIEAVKEDSFNSDFGDSLLIELLKNKYLKYFNND